MDYIRVVTRLTAIAAVTLVGAGACAVEPQDDRAGGRELPSASAAEGVTGGMASPAPEQSSSGGPSTAATPSPAQTTLSPRTTTSPKTSPSAGQGSGCPQGDRQRDVETALARLGGFGPITVDGKQSAADCAAIKKFQQRYGIRPVEGRAGPTTADVAKRLAATDTAKCRAGEGTTFCVDLTLQTVWAMRDGKVVMKPTVTRTGMGGGYQTPAGTFTINYRNIKEWSNPYEVWLPYWQHFTQGMGFHETTTYLHNKGIGSHGCVNMLPVDARRLWELGRVGTRVHLFGRRPGT